MAQSASIFVLIASFRDPECAKTLTDMYEQAADPERVFAGICWQYDPDDPFDCTEPGFALAQNVRVDRVPFKESEGVCWARSRAQALFRDEDYVLVIDSHMRFEPEWDRRLIAELEACPGQKSILSCYPPSFTLPLKKKYPPPIVNCAEMRPVRWPPPDERYPNGSVRGQLDFLALRSKYDEPIRGAFFAAGYSFMPADVLKNIPFDPFIDWEEEEIYYSIKLWTHGWNIYAPREHLVHHLYARDRDDKGTHYFRRHIPKERLVERFLRSKRRYFHLLGEIECDDPAALTDLAKYGLGQARTLRDFEAFSGVYIRSQHVSIRALESWFSLLSPAHYLNHRWDRLRDSYAFEYEDGRFPQVPSGSRPDATRTVRAGLMDAFDDMGARSLLDLACGGSDWLRPEETPLDQYIGIDFIPEAIGPLKDKYSANKRIEYRLQDIRRSPLPSCDAVLARDCFTHFSYRDIVDSLRNIKNSGARYLFVSHYKDIEKNLGVKAKQGSWNRLDLTLPPYSFPEPLRIIDDLPKRGKFLGVWRVNAIPELSPNPTLRAVSNSIVGTVFDNVLCCDETEYLASLRFADAALAQEQDAVIPLDLDTCSTSVVFRGILDRIRTVFGLRSHAFTVHLTRVTAGPLAVKLPITGPVVVIPLLRRENWLSLQSGSGERASEQTLLLGNGAAAFIPAGKERPCDTPLLLEVAGISAGLMEWDFCVIEAEPTVISSAEHEASEQQALGDDVHRLVAGGDFMLSREMPGFVGSKGADWPTRELQPYLSAADIALVNLECVISGRGAFFDKGERRPYYYRAPAEMVNVLVAAGVTATTTANNHAMDFGPDALVEQSALLSRAGIAAAGGGGNIKEASRPIYLRAGDLIVAVISFATDQKLLAASDSSGGIFSAQGSPAALGVLAQVIREARSHADLVVVSPHWGTNWRESPSEDIRRLAWGIIDEGADAILGHSAHILQGIEVYAGRPIVYDMGSLLFDRVFENRLRFSALFELLFDHEGLHGLVIRPLKLEPGQVRPATLNERGAIFRLLEGLSKELGSAASFNRSSDTLELRLRPTGTSPRQQYPHETFERNAVRPLSHIQWALDDANIFSSTPPPEFSLGKALDFGDGLTVLGARCVSEVRTGYGFLVEVYFRLRDCKGRNWRASLWAKERVTGADFLYRHPIAEGAWLPDPPPDDRIACDRLIVRPPRRPTPGTYDLYWALVDVATNRIWRPAEKIPCAADNRVHVGVIRFTDSAPPRVGGLVAECTVWSFADWS